MTKKIIGLTILSVMMSQNAWAGSLGVPEIPTGFEPLIFLGITGIALWVRYLIRR